MRQASARRSSCSLPSSISPAAATTRSSAALRSKAAWLSAEWNAALGFVGVMRTSFPIKRPRAVTAHRVRTFFFLLLFVLFVFVVFLFVFLFLWFVVFL